MDIFWEKAGWEREDPHLRSLSELPFQRSFPELKLLPGLYVIRGPRQVGKTSWMKQLLSQKAKKNSEACFYFSCENLRDHLDLAQLLEDSKKRKWIFLDEVTFVSEWARAVKNAWDSGKFHCLVLTGSNMHDLRKGGERMPGRHLKPNDLLLLPMGFEEYCRVYKQAGWKERTRFDLIKKYFQTGGFPSALAEVGEKDSFPSVAMDVYQRWLVGDFSRMGKQETYLKEILIQLAEVMGTPISLQKLAQRTQLGSHHTVLEYLQILEDCYALRTLYAMDPNTGALRNKKEKKYYFTDPLLFWMARSLGGAKDRQNQDEKLAEMVAHEFLARTHPRFGYLPSAKGEVDFYLRNEWAVEVKWAPSTHNLSQAFKNLRLANKKIWNQENFLG